MEIDLFSEFNNYLVNDMIKEKREWYNLVFNRLLNLSHQLEAEENTAQFILIEPLFRWGSVVGACRWRLNKDYLNSKVNISHLNRDEIILMATEISANVDGTDSSEGRKEQIADFFVQELEKIIRKLDSNKVFAYLISNISIFGNKSGVRLRGRFTIEDEGVPFEDVMRALNKLAGDNYINEVSDAEVKKGVFFSEYFLPENLSYRKYQRAYIEYDKYEHEEVALYKFSHE